MPDSSADKEVIYQKLLEQVRNSIYSSKLIELPTPKCVVFYNGDEEQPDEVILKLSDAYTNKEVVPDVELTVRVININYGHNKELMTRCNTLNDYSILIEKVNEYKQIYELKEAINMAIDFCIENGILEDFLNAQRAKVIGMLSLRFDRKKYEYSLKEEGREEGIEQGIQQGEIVTLITLVKEGEITKESAAKRLNITVEEFDKMLQK